MRNERIEKYLLESQKMIFDKQVEQAIDMLNDLLVEEPAYGALHNHMGWAHLYYTLNYKQAEIHLKAAIRFQPEYHASYQHLGTLYFRQERYPEAIEVLTVASTLPHANKRTVFDLIGQSYELMRKYKLAIRAYREAMFLTLMSDDMNFYLDCIKRCKKKRWKAIFS